MLINRLIIFLNRIPFIDDDNNALPTFMRNSRNLGVLFRHALRRVNHNKHHVRALHCRYRTDNTVAFQFFFNLILAPQTGRVNKHIRFAVMNHFCVNGISRCPRNIRDNHAVASHQLIYNRRFAHIRLSDNGDTRPFVFFFQKLFRCKMTRNRVKKLSKPQL